jgi:hypothetical protein
MAPECMRVPADVDDSLDLVGQAVALPRVLSSEPLNQFADFIRIGGCPLVFG